MRNLCKSYDRRLRCSFDSKDYTSQAGIAACTMLLWGGLVQVGLVPKGTEPSNTMLILEQPIQPNILPHAIHATATYLAIFFPPFDLIVTTTANTNIRTCQDLVRLFRLWIMPECKRILMFGWPAFLFLLGTAGRRWWHGWVNGFVSFLLRCGVKLLVAKGQGQKTMPTINPLGSLGSVGVWWLQSLHDKRDFS